MMDGRSVGGFVIARSLSEVVIAVVLLLAFIFGWGVG